VDAESSAWLRALSSDGAQREEALARLHALLQRAARFEIARRRSQVAHLPAGELNDLALQVADDATVAMLDRLDEFRGLSRFSTWAYKFALLQSAVTVRRLAWRQREVVVSPDGWNTLADPGGRPEDSAEHRELLAALHVAVAERLTPLQRDVLLTAVVGQVPIDVLAERRGTTRGALYKTVHDARRKLRAHLREIGLLRGDGRGQR
jgi:RNA polymerase sigma-70 factor (ECF subfamily)